MQALLAEPGMAARTLCCSSLSKTFHITGWRLGYVQASAAVIAQARKVHDFLTVGAAAPLQHAVVTALNFPPEYYEGLAAEYAAALRYEDLPREVLTKLLCAFEEQSSQQLAYDDPGAWARQTLGRVRDWLGTGVPLPGINVVQQRRSPMTRALMDILKR